MSFWASAVVDHWPLIIDIIVGIGIGSFVYMNIAGYPKRHHSLASLYSGFNISVKIQSESLILAGIPFSIKNVIHGIPFFRNFALRAS